MIQVSSEERFLNTVPIDTYGTYNRCISVIVEESPQGPQAFLPRRATSHTHRHEKLCRDDYKFFFFGRTPIERSSGCMVGFSLRNLKRFPIFLHANKRAAPPSNCFCPEVTVPIMKDVYCSVFHSDSHYPYLGFVAFVHSSCDSACYIYTTRQFFRLGSVRTERHLPLQLMTGKNNCEFDSR